VHKTRTIFLAEREQVAPPGVADRPEQVDETDVFGPPSEAVHAPAKAIACQNGDSTLSRSTPGEQSMSEPTYAHGKICYIQMPAIDVTQSAGFYRTVFGWNTRTHADGSTAFDDTTGQVSGMWDTSLKAVEHPGLVVSIMVTDAVATSEAITAAGGTIVTPIDPTAREFHGTFRDPAGNLMSIYQHDG
jgi:predicted enzyme related to lactoylglutathione lyase